MTTTQLMTTRRTTGRLIGALATGALLATVAACGSDDPAGTTTTVTPPHTSATSTGGHGGMTATPPHDFAAAQQVTVRVSGGLKPVQRTVVFADDQPPPRGFSKHDVATVLQAAADPELKTVPTPRDICCDQFLYRVTITYPDTTSTTFTAVLGVGNPAAVQHLLDLVA
jgi:hypothetical protein